MDEKQGAAAPKTKSAKKPHVAKKPAKKIGKGPAKYTTLKSLSVAFVNKTFPKGAHVSLNDDMLYVTGKNNEDLGCIKDVAGAALKMLGVKIKKK